MGIEIVDEVVQDNAKIEKNEVEKHEKEELGKNKDEKDCESHRVLRHELNIEQTNKAKLDIKLNDSQKHVCVQLITRFLRYFLLTVISSKVFIIFDSSMKFN